MSNHVPSAFALAVDLYEKFRDGESLKGKSDDSFVIQRTINQLRNNAYIDKSGRITVISNTHVYCVDSPQAERLKTYFFHKGYTYFDVNSTTFILKLYKFL